MIQSPDSSAVEHQTFNLRVQGSSPCLGERLSYAAPSWWSNSAADSLLEWCLFILWGT